MAYQLQDTLTALADPTRRSIFDALNAQPRSVSQLAKVQPVSRPAVSQHLKVLQEAGLVRAKAEGTKRIYAVRREGLEHLRSYLDRFWGDVLEAYAGEIEKHYGGSNDRTGTDED